MCAQVLKFAGCLMWWQLWSAELDPKTENNVIKSQTNCIIMALGRITMLIPFKKRIKEQMVSPSRGRGFRSKIHQHETTSPTGESITNIPQTEPKLLTMQIWLWCTWIFEVTILLKLAIKLHDYSILKKGGCVLLNKSHTFSFESIDWHLFFIFFYKLA